jgi:hypothetical protein
MFFKTTGRQTDGQTDRQTDKQTDRQTEGQNVVQIRTGQSRVWDHQSLETHGHRSTQTLGTKLGLKIIRRYNNF